LELTRKEYRRLESYLQAAPGVRVYRKAAAVLAVHDGTPVNEVARVLRVHRLSVYNWLRAYDEARDPAALSDRYHGSRPESWSGEVVAALRKALEQPPDAWGYHAVNWTSPLLRAHLERDSGLKVSDRTVRRLLHEMKYVWKRPRHALRDAKSPRVLRRLRLIRQKVRNLPAGCAKLFEDETDLLFFPPLRAGWFLRGTPAQVPISGVNAKRTIFGTIDVETGHRILISRQEACAKDYQVLLPLIRKEYGERQVAVLLDRASRHTAQESKRAAAELDIELIWLPRRCTNVNPMDRLWRWGKDKTCANRQHASIDDQADFFIRYVLGLSPREALRQAGLLAENFWLFRSTSPNERRQLVES
jgi:transposase